MSTTAPRSAAERGPPGASPRAACGTSRSPARRPRWTGCRARTSTRAASPSPSALPLGFHPAGDRLLFEEPGKRYREARFTGNWSEEEKPFFGGRLSGGTATWLANGLGLVHWTSGVAGVELVFAPKMESRRVAAEWTFATTPANVPDGRGLVGLTKGADGRQALRYVPVEIPLGNVVNAWMFVEGKDDADRFARHGGLFRTSDAEQLHSVYDAELYTGSTARRPFVVTTDVFWEDFAAAFQGLFVLRERVQAIPAFWEFVKGARTALSGPGGSKVWGPVFAAAAELEAAAGSAKPAAGIGPEAARILGLKTADSPVVGPAFPYGEMKPRGNYAATPRMRSYFMAFRYLTEVARREVERRPPAERANALADLASLPPAVKAKARTWIGAYEPFIAPGRAPVVFDDRPFVPPAWASRPADGPGLFPLSFGFDNEVFLTTVFHESWPAPEQIQDPGNRRLLPVGPRPRGRLRQRVRPDAPGGRSEAIPESRRGPRPPRREVAPKSPRVRQEPLALPPLARRARGAVGRRGARGRRGRQGPLARQAPADRPRLVHDAPAHDGPRQRADGGRSGRRRLGGDRSQASPRVGRSRPGLFRSDRGPLRRGGGPREGREDPARTGWSRGRRRSTAGASR